MLSFILSVSTSFLVSLFITPLMISVAKKKNIYDIPNGRKDHKSPTPLLGGVAIFIGTITSILLFTRSSQAYVVPILVAGVTGVTFMGLIDDLISLSAKRRMIILLCISIIVYFGSVRFYFDITTSSLFMDIVFSVFIIFWIVGITNAINFSDGLDGLASYLSLVSAIAFAIIFSLQGRNMFALPMALALFGALAGFIPYNRNPAMVFMGDAGSMFIGFMLGLLSISAIAKESTQLAVIVPIYILFVPILDMCMSILRRLVVKQSIMTPDRLHFHHKLNEHFKNHLIVVMILSLTQVVFAAAGIFIFLYKQYVLGWIVLLAIMLISSIYTVVSALKVKARAASK